jgi:predicted Zn-dependent peptidase
MKHAPKPVFLPLLVFLTTLLLLGPGGHAQTFDAIKAGVREHTLSNGMTILVLERHDAPVVSFHTWADVGSANECVGRTGISHILEHMAFKGTKTIGTKDYAAESKVLDKIDQIYADLVREQDALKPDEAKIATLKEEFDKANKEASEYEVVGEYWDMIREQGGQGLNAMTNFDATRYVLSMPSNKLELWMAMESDRFMNPVLREFFQERDVIMEERRLSVETRPIGKLFEDLMAVAFKAHPYHHHVIGHMSDLKRINRQDVYDYFRKYYIPSNITIAIVGDVDAPETFKLAETYFGRIPSGPKPEPIRTVEPEQWGERRVEVKAQSQPILLVAYHRPNIRSGENVAFEGLANVIGQGRSSRIYETLVKEKKIAVQAGAMATFPGQKYPTLFAFFAIPAKDHTSAECLDAIDAEIQKLKAEPITDLELQKYKRDAKMSLINRMKSNSRMAGLLAEGQVLLGDWREIFEDYKRIEAVKADDIRAAADKYLIPTNRTIGEVVPES